MTRVTPCRARGEELNGHNQKVASLSGLIHQEVPLRQEKVKISRQTHIILLLHPRFCPLLGAQPCIGLLALLLRCLLLGLVGAICAAPSFVHIGFMHRSVALQVLFWLQKRRGDQQPVVAQDLGLTCLGKLRGRRLEIQ